MTTPGGADVTGLLEHSDLRRAARIVAAQAGPSGPAPTMIASDSCNRRCAYFPHTSCATSTVSLSLAHCSSSVRMLPSSVDANPHCGDSAS